MSDNFDVTPGTGAKCATDELTYSDDVAFVQVVRLAHVSGAEGGKALQEVFGNSTPAVGAYGLIVRKPVVSHAHLITAGSGDATSVKAAAGTLKSVHVFNKSAAPLYVKFHNTAGAPTPGTGVVLTIGVQAGTHRDVVLPDGGRAFATGIGMSVVSGIADNSSSGVSAADAAIEVTYE